MNNVNTVIDAVAPVAKKARKAIPIKVDNGAPSAVSVIVHALSMWDAAETQKAQAEFRRENASQSLAYGIMCFHAELSEKASRKSPVAPLLACVSPGEARTHFLNTLRAEQGLLKPATKEMKAENKNANNGYSTEGMRLTRACELIFALLQIKVTRHDFDAVGGIFTVPAAPFLRNGETALTSGTEALRVGLCNEPFPVAKSVNGKTVIINSMAPTATALTRLFPVEKASRATRGVTASATVSVPATAGLETARNVPAAIANITREMDITSAFKTIAPAIRQAIKSMGNVPCHWTSLPDDTRNVITDLVALVDQMKAYDVANPLPKAAVETSQARGVKPGRTKAA